MALQASAPPTPRPPSHDDDYHQAVARAEQDPELALRVLRRHWGARALFRPLQLEAVRALLAGRE